MVLPDINFRRHLHGTLIFRHGELHVVVVGFFFLLFFLGALENMQHSVSATLVESQLRDGGIGLIWNVSAPCILEAEVWLCKKGQVGGQCEEVMGSRQRLQAKWDERSNRYLVKTAKILSVM